MKNLVWSPTFIRAFKRVLKKNPELRSQIEQVLQQIAEDPFHPSSLSRKLCRVKERTTETQRTQRNRKTREMKKLIHLAKLV
ncbi:hypothetical protein NIES4103_09600 [Nostoc sp. NIES-4103]|nr:hypothetical protein NIES4103_09600 [Nostoc sp. NIES-4103]